MKCDDLYLHITNPIAMMRVDRKTASFVSYSDINGAVFDRGGFGTEISTVHKQAGIHCNPVWNNTRHTSYWGTEQSLALLSTAN